MNNLYDQALKNMEHTLALLTVRVQPPIRMPYKNSFNFRYTEKSLHQALVQKLARTVSGLHAARLLMENGFTQEQAAMQRMLDEIHEDITFLSYAVIFNNKTELHQKYLDAFYEEEFDKDSALASTQKRPMPPRKRIHAYIANSQAAKLNPSQGIELSRTLNKTYSGYVHAASPQTMEMYMDNPPRYLVHGMKESPLYPDHRADLWNNFYRAIISFSFAAKAFGDEELFSKIYSYTQEFLQLSGKNYLSKEWDE